jgi:hypothetical protein
MAHRHFITYVSSDLIKRVQVDSRPEQLIEQLKANGFECRGGHATKDVLTEDWFKAGENGHFESYVIQSLSDGAKLPSEQLFEKVDELKSLGTFRSHMTVGQVLEK